MPFRKTANLTASRTAQAFLLVVVLCGLGGCAAGVDGAALTQASGGATVTFESIDGPPPQVFDRMVSLLDSESKLRNLAVVPREVSAAYRIRSYLAAQVSRGRTTIAWVWDVYDRDQQRALRLSGEETAGKPGRDAWGSADDVVLRRIAQAGLSGLSGMINGTTAPGDTQPIPSPTKGSGPAVASADDTTSPPNQDGGNALGFTAR
jgi:hypothetical protein